MTNRELKYQLLNEAYSLNESMFKNMFKKKKSDSTSVNNITENQSNAEYDNDIEKYGLSEIFKYSGPDDVTIGSVCNMIANDYKIIAAKLSGNSKFLSDVKKVLDYNKAGYDEYLAEGEDEDEVEEDLKEYDKKMRGVPGKLVCRASGLPSNTSDTSTNFTINLFSNGGNGYITLDYNDTKMTIPAPDILKYIGNKIKSKYNNALSSKRIKVELDARHDVIHVFTVSYR